MTQTRTLAKRNAGFAGMKATMLIQEHPTMPDKYVLVRLVVNGSTAFEADVLKRPGG